MAAHKLAQETGAAPLTDYRALLDRQDVDAVVIAVPDDAHLAPALDAIVAGKHVLLEKPLATTLADGRQIVQAVEQSGDRVFLVGHLLRYDPRFAAAAGQTAAGQIGDLVYLSLRRNGTVAGPQRDGRRASLPFHLGVHDADLIHFLTRRTVTGVYAQAVRKASDAAGQVDSLLAIVNLTGGALAAMELSWVLPARHPTVLDAAVEIVGARGVLYVDTASKGWQWSTNRAAPDTVRYTEQGGRAYGLAARQAQHFVDCIDGLATPQVSVHDGYEAIRVCQALVDSIACGRTVPLPN